MKKLISLMICFIMLFSCTCFADVNFNPDDYTDEELGEIYGIISEKLYSCVEVPAGIYVVGKDLPAGLYTILSNSDLDDSDSDNFSHVAVFNNMDEYNQSGGDFFGDESPAVMACNTLWNGMSMELTDDMVLVVKMGIAGLSKTKSSIFASFWEND